MKKLTKQLNMHALLKISKRILSLGLYIFCKYISILLFITSGKCTKNRQKLKSLYNIHKNKRCFIIGNGPSLKPEDLETLYLNNEISFAVNKISYIFPETNWRPTYYSVFDDFLPRKIKNIISETPASKKFFRKNSFLFTRKVNGECLYCNTKGNRNLLKNPKFSADISEKIFAIATVTYVSMQIAVYMGITEIYLLGIDNAYSLDRKKNGTIVKNNSIKSYFGALEKTDNRNVGALWEMDIAYKAANEYAKQNDIKIYNATRGGKLEIFERVNFDSLF
ncbi:hypothetical protein EZS27_024234 [termite gut metagenome]|uniref:6-hydroxymethylpterin diphosphokinase MptE-like domain-containing protein n=1 Tax=termite gut metagenome TaxID=433724 RepID=A0A5J4QZH5_9ZZZZ